MNSHPIKLLLVEDDEEDFVLIRTWLAKNEPGRYTLDWAPTFEAGRQALQQQSHDIYLVDYRLGAENGLDLLLHAIATGCSAPFIMLTGQNVREVDLAAMQAGAADYLVKSELTPSLLERSLRYARERQRLMGQVQASETRLRNIIANSVDGILIIDTQGCIQFVNPAAERLFSRSSVELIGEPFGFPVIDGERTELVITDRVQSAVTVEMRVAKVEWDGDTAYLASLRDVTERVAMDAALSASQARAQALVNIAQRLNAQVDLDATLQAICEEAARMLRVPVATVSLYDENQHKLCHAHGIGIPSDFAELGQVASWGMHQEYAQEPGTPVVIDDMQSVPASPNSERYVHMHLRTVVHIDLMRQKTLIGRLYIGTSGETRQFGKDEMSLLQGLAALAAQAIARASLYSQSQQRLAWLQGLHTIDQAIITAQELPATLQVIVEEVAVQLGVDAVSVLLVEPEVEELTFGAGCGFRTDGIQHSRLTLGQGYAGRAATTRQIQTVLELHAVNDSVRSALLNDEGFVSYYGVPLIAQDHLVGVLDIYHRERLEPDTEWLRFLESLALQLAIAVDHATLFSETRRLLQQTQTQTQQLHQILTTVPAGVILLDAGHRVLMANAAAQEYLARLTDRTDDDRVTHLGGRPVASLLAAPGADTTVHEIITEGADTSIFEVVAQPLVGSSESEQLVITMIDVSQARKMQERVHQHERLAAVGKLAAGIAHDFNNVMGTIILFSQLLARAQELSKRNQERVGTIIKQAQHATNLIRQILDFSRSSIIERSSIDLVPVMQDMVKLLDRTLPALIELKLDVAPGEYGVDADLSRLQQVLLNLALNARDAMPEGGTLRFGIECVRVQEGEDPPVPGLATGAWQCLSVSDTGSGIPAHVLPHIFDPFFTTKAPDQGTGLGLSQVYGIIKQHDGEVVVESHEGQGTTFAIYLPAAGLTAPAPAVNEQQPVATNRGRETILVVEDNDIVQHAIRAILEDSGYRVLSAGNGRQALAVFEQYEHSIDLVLSDIVMPEMGGMELLHILRARQPDVKVILTTGYPLQEIDKESLLQRTVHWIRKPFFRTELTESVKAVLEDRV